MPSSMMFCKRLPPFVDQTTNPPVVCVRNHVPARTCASLCRLQVEPDRFRMGEVGAARKVVVASGQVANIFPPQPAVGGGWLLDLTQCTQMTAVSVARCA